MFPYHNTTIKKYQRWFQIASCYFCVISLHIDYKFDVQHNILPTPKIQEFKNNDIFISVYQYGLNMLIAQWISEITDILKYKIVSFWNISVIAAHNFFAPQFCLPVLIRIFSYLLHGFIVSYPSICGWSQADIFNNFLHFVFLLLFLYRKMWPWQNFKISY